MRALMRKIVLWLCGQLGITGSDLRTEEGFDAFPPLEVHRLTRDCQLTASACTGLFTDPRDGLRTYAGDGHQRRLTLPKGTVARLVAELRRDDELDYALLAVTTPDGRTQGLVLRTHGMGNLLSACHGRQARLRSVL